MNKRTVGTIAHVDNGKTTLASLVLQAARADWREELRRAMKDAATYGAGFSSNGRHVPLEDVYIARDYDDGGGPVRAALMFNE